MATTSTSSNFSTDNKYIKYRIQVTENSVDINNNSSNVTVKVQAWRTNTGYETYGSGTCYVTIDGINYSQSIISSQKITYNSYTTLFTKTLNITHNANGTKSIYVSSYINHSRFTSSSQGFTVQLSNIPRQATILSVQNFTDEGNPTITYQNNAGNVVTSLQACISLTGSRDDIPYRDISVNGSSYTFNLTQAERNTLLQACVNSNTLTVYFYIKTVLNGNTYYSNMAATMTVVNAKPTIQTIAYQDTNSTITAITGNNQQIVRNKSTLQFTLTNLKSYKYATIQSVVASINGISKNFTGISGTTISSSTLNFGTLNVANNINAEITITDSRGNKTVYQKPLTILNYESPYASITLNRQSNFYTETDLLVNATYSSLNNNNSINIQYQYKKVAETNYGALTTIQNNTQTTIQLDNKYEWNVKIILTDRLGTSVNYITSVDVGIPQIFYDRKLRSMGVNCFPVNENSVESQGVQLDDKIYAGSQVLYTEFDTTTSGLTSLLGCYDYGLVEGLLNGVNIPDDYEEVYRITAQISTTNNNQASVLINNIETSRANTWSNNTMRKNISSAYFKKSDIVLETAYGYTRNGTNLKIKNYDPDSSSTPKRAYFYNITLHAYLIKKQTVLVTTLSNDYDSIETSPAS